MQLSDLPATTRLKTPAAPYHLEGGPEAVQLIHGYTGHPGEMRFLAETLWNAGYTVRVPRLPGHGTTGDDFLKTDERDWYRRCVDTYLELASRYERVSLVGLSMGGLLAALLAAQFPCARLVLLAPATHVTTRTLPLARLLAPFLSRVPGEPAPTETAENPEEAEIYREYHGHTWVRPAAGLRRLQRSTRKCLPRVTADTLCIVSQQDETVPARAAGYIQKHIGSSRVETVRLQESGHVLVRDIEHERVANHVLSWLRDGATSAGEQSV